MPEENRVFDVAKPGRGQPQATSKPVIVGHHPAISDPMVRDSDSPGPTKISVLDSHDDLTEQPEHNAKSQTAMGHNDIPIYTPPASMDETPPASSPVIEPAAPAVYDSQDGQSGSADPLVPEPTLAEPIRPLDTTPPEPKETEPAAGPPAHVESLQPAHVKKRNPLKWLGMILIVVLIATYVLLGTGVIKNSLNLPPFKKKNTPAVTPPASQSQSAQPSLPTGFTKYNLSGTNITFAAPTSWGTPGSTTDPGYTKRGGSNQSDGVHAYIVDFPSNKNVEIAVTSSKYLPASRGPLYYDYLQWCTGTADGKYYFSALEFSTAGDKTETPTTVTCDQGPLNGVTQLDTQTIVQPALKSSSGQTLGDLYTKNLTNNPDLPVIRVKDAAMTNSAAIKQLLGTVQSTAAASTGSSGSQ